MRAWQLLQSQKLMTVPLSYNKAYAFNAICPYYTMFPLEYPLRIMRKHREKRTVIHDPFCGRGTTVYAARKLGIKSHGLDTSPIAAAIARAKLASASIDEVLSLCETLIARKPKNIPESPFFRRAFSKNTLIQLCSLREGLIAQRWPSNASAILRAVALGCLHGPLTKRDKIPSYFSNQMPRTFSSKPDYSVRYWKKNALFPPNASVVDVIKKKLERISDLNSESFVRLTSVKCADARKKSSFNGLPKASLTITSPPYYGMNTYVQDQWLRMWFLGGDEEIEYQNNNQLSHNGQEAFITDLAKVWLNVRRNSRPGAHLFIRFGSISSAQCDPRNLLISSLEEAGGWRLVSVRSAHTSFAGKRQAEQMAINSKPSDEYDFHAMID